RRIGDPLLRLLADRELDAAAVVDRPARGRNHDVLAVLARRKPAERRGADALQPRCSQERDPEGDDEDREQEPDAAVRGLRAHRARGPSRTYVVSAGSAGTSPKRFCACSWMRGAAAAIESCEASGCFSARRRARWWLSLSGLPA